jgi:hypothetical protein
MFLITNQGGSDESDLGRSKAGKTGSLHTPAPALILAASYLLLASMAIYSVLGTRDYLSYYRTEWIARKYVVSQGVPPDLIFNVPDWGPAFFDGDYLNDAEMTMSGPVPHADSGYQVGTSVPPGYEVVKQYPIWLALNRHEIVMYVSKRQ